MSTHVQLATLTQTLFAKSFEEIDANVKYDFFVIFTYFKYQLRSKKLQADLSSCPPLSLSKLEFSLVVSW